jgi:OmpA-OmpF porin, OOP family
MIRLEVLAVAVAILPLAARADPDAEGCKDAFVSRMAHFHIRQCDMKDFDAFTFAEGSDKESRVEGRIVINEYEIDEGATAPSALAVRRNYENALKQSGWTVVYGDADNLIERQEKDGKQRWVQLDYNGGSGYRLVLAQKGTLEQSVTTADDMMSAIDSAGHVALHLNFDTGKATLRPDAQPTLDEVTKLLKAHPDLKLGVEGHTDNVGGAAANKKLSESRAKAVVAALVGKGIAAGRLVPAGFGQEKPVASNDTEEGRAQNRRVELVKR